MLLHQKNTAPGAPEAPDDSKAGYSKSGLFGGLHQTLMPSRKSSSSKITRKGSNNMSVVSGFLRATKSPNMLQRNLLMDNLKSPTPNASNPLFTPGNKARELSNFTYNEDQSVRTLVSNNNMKVNVNAINKSIAAS